MSYWLFEVVAIPITALLPILLFPALGIISTHEICSSYLKDTSLLILCTLMIALAVEESSLHNRLALFVLSKFGGYPLAVMIAISSVVTFISIWVTNTSATALTLPITIRILELMIQTRSFSVESNGTHGHGKSKSRNSVKERLKFDLLSCEDRALCKTLVLICAHGALIGGTAMVTGSSTNLIFRELYHTQHSISSFA
ncbi:unnamed protein product [Anisakis simplex]|uniref:SLC13A9 n=1 Tax=Anisakis simplex TaxID=6269 RepID=A0A0M3KFQ7_ANISI|nr:unnamed protein product [Anisakis simplex]